MSRFSYVKYDPCSERKQTILKEQFEALESFLELHLINGRAKALCLTKLEEAYMWVGKAIRDEQIAVNGSGHPERNGE